MHWVTVTLCTDSCVVVLVSGLQTTSLAVNGPTLIGKTAVNLMTVKFRKITLSLLSFPAALFYVYSFLTRVCACVCVAGEKKRRLVVRQRTRKRMLLWRGQRERMYFYFNRSIVPVTTN